MAKKFAAIEGLHLLYGTTTTTTEDYQTLVHYNLSDILDDYQSTVNKNTICFLIADSDDAGCFIGGIEINEGDKFIVVQKNVFSHIDNSDPEPTPENTNTWRPIYVNNYQDEEAIELPVNFTSDSDDWIYFDQYIADNMLNIRCNLKLEDLRDYISTFCTENFKLDLTVGEGNLYFELADQEVNSVVDGEETQISINQNTIDVEGSFNANAADDTPITIHYKGTADRVDWYVDRDSRTSEGNNSSGKKFVYIEPIREYFDPSDTSFPSYNSVRYEKRNIIGEDSIVFITCGTLDGVSDAEAFNNPEYQDGTRFIWMHGKMFSANTWGPLFISGYNASTASSKKLIPLNPIIGSSVTKRGGRVIFEGTGGIDLLAVNEENSNDVRVIIDGSGVQGSTGSSTVALKDGVATQVSTNSDNKTQTNVIRQPYPGTVTPGSDIDETTNRPNSSWSKDNDLDTEEVNHDSHKNFLRVHNAAGIDYSWLEVNGVDSDAVYFAERMHFGGSDFAEMILPDLMRVGGGSISGTVGNRTVTGNKFLENYPSDSNDNNIYVKAGTNLHEFLSAILYKFNEVWPSVTDLYHLLFDTSLGTNNSISINSVKIDSSAITSGTVVPLNSVLDFDLTGKGKAIQDVSITGMTFGYEVNDEESSLTSYTKSDYVPEVGCVIAAVNTTTSNLISSSSTSTVEQQDGKCEINTLITSIPLSTENTTYKFDFKNTITAAIDSDESMYGQIIKYMSSTGNTNNSHRFDITKSKFSSPISSVKQTSTFIVTTENWGTNSFTKRAISASGLDVSIYDANGNRITSGSSIVEGTTINFRIVPSDTITVGTKSSLVLNKPTQVNYLKSDNTSEDINFGSSSKTENASKQISYIDSGSQSQNITFTDQVTKTTIDGISGIPVVNVTVKIKNENPVTLVSFTKSGSSYTMSLASGVTAVSENGVFAYFNFETTVPEYSSSSTNISYLFAESGTIDTTINEDFILLFYSNYSTPNIYTTYVGKTYANLLNTSDNNHIIQSSKLFDEQTAFSHSLTNNIVVKSTPTILVQNEVTNLGGGPLIFDYTITNSLINGGDLSSYLDLSTNEKTNTISGKTVKTYTKQYEKIDDGFVYNPLTTIGITPTGKLNEFLICVPQNSVSQAQFIENINTSLGTDIENLTTGSIQSGYYNSPVTINGKSYYVWYIIAEIPSSFGTTDNWKISSIYYT